MKIFVDTANLDEIKQALDTGWVDGVTTNPSLLAKEPKAKFEEHIGKIVELLKPYWRTDEGVTSYPHLSVEVFHTNPDRILIQAAEFSKMFDYPVSIKVQVGWNELALIRRLAASGISVNCTACMTVSQAAWAAKAGAKYASLFWGRIRDASPKVANAKIAELDFKPTLTGDDKEKYALLARHRGEATGLLQSGAMTEADFDPVSVVQRTRAIFDRETFRCEIIAGSMRTIWDVRDAMLAGAHIVTVPFKFFKEFHLMAEHYKTDEVISQFLKDFNDWLK